MDHKEIISNLERMAFSNEYMMPTDEAERLAELAVEAIHLLEKSKSALSKTEQKQAERLLKAWEAFTDL